MKYHVHLNYDDAYEVEADNEEEGIEVAISCVSKNDWNVSIDEVEE